MKIPNITHNISLSKAIKKKILRNEGTTLFLNQAISLPEIKNIAKGKKITIQNNPLCPKSLLIKAKDHISVKNLFQKRPSAVNMAFVETFDELKKEISKITQEAGELTKLFK